MEVNGRRRRGPVPDGMKLMSQYDIKVVNWLWDARIAMGKLTMLEGDPARGKSMITADWAARVTTGEPWPATWPGRGQVRPRGVVMVCAEDDPEDTLKPRLLAAGADDRKVAFMTVKVETDEEGNNYYKPFTIPRDLDRLAEYVRYVKASLVIIDPVAAYLGERTDSHNDSSTRRALTPLQEMAQALGVAVVMVRHFNKDSNLKAEYRGGGSIAFGAAARSVLVVERHPDDAGSFCLAQVKNNLAARASTMTYSIESADVEIGDGESIAVPRIEWGEPIQMSADELLRGHDGRREAPLRDECITAMMVLLEEKDPRPAKDMRRLLREKGFSEKTIKTAKKELGVWSKALKRDGMTKEWLWTLKHG